MNETQNQQRTHTHKPRNAMTYASDGQSETDLCYRTTPLPIASHRWNRHSNR